MIRYRGLPRRSAAYRRAAAPWFALAMALAAFVPGSDAWPQAQVNKPTPRIAPNVHQAIKGTATALQGDRLLVNRVSVRLAGIDAPNPGQTCEDRFGHSFDCFRIAREVLANLVKDEEVNCVVADQDRNGQSVGECFVRGVDLGGAMVARGWAFPYYSLSHAYDRAASYAQSKRFGLWAGRVEKPWEWRSRMQREKAR